MLSCAMPIKARELEDMNALQRNYPDGTSDLRGDEVAYLKVCNPAPQLGGVYG